MISGDDPDDGRINDYDTVISAIVYATKYEVVSTSNV